MAFPATPARHRTGGVTKATSPAIALRTPGTTAVPGIGSNERHRMDFNKLTLKARKLSAAAQELARRMGNPELYPEHLLLALLDQELPQQLVPDAAALRARGRGDVARSPPCRACSSSRTSRLPSRACSTRPPTRRSGWRTTTSRRSTCCSRSTSSRATTRGEDQGVRGGQRVTSQDPGGEVPGAREVRPRPDRSRAGRASSTRSSAATRRSAASSRCCRAARRTTRC